MSREWTCFALARWLGKFKFDLCCLDRLMYCTAVN